MDQPWVVRSSDGQFQCPLCQDWHTPPQSFDPLGPDTGIDPLNTGIHPLTTTTFLQAQHLRPDVLYWVEKSTYYDGEVFYVFSMTLGTTLHFKHRCGLETLHHGPRRIYLLTRSQFETLMETARRQTKAPVRFHYRTRPLYITYRMPEYDVVNQFLTTLPCVWSQKSSWKVS